ncbi:hypothetical protein B0H11DRAFT_2003389 [Mycena galericulata]|nr:hypothetical protein B0H11DRAFT_2003389 [Mycena galericulata]
MVSNVEKINIQGVDGTSFQLDPSKMASDGSKPVVIMTNSGPYITSAKAMADVIPDRGPLVRPCGACFKTPPEGGPPFAKCSQCATTHYCSRQCQTKHWKEHKPVCKQRVEAMAYLAEQREAARLAGKKFCTPLTIQTWYRNQNSAIEYAAFYALELHKGAAASLLATHIVVFSVRVDATNPEDAARVRLVDVFPAPLEAFAQKVRMDDAYLSMCLVARRRAQMALYFIDLQENLRLIEFHEAPPAGVYTSAEKAPDEHWRVHVMIKLNGGLPTS